MRYCLDSIEARMPPPKVMQALRDAGLVDVLRHVELGIVSEYVALKT